MKRLLLLFIILTSQHRLIAQVTDFNVDYAAYGVINDPDGFVNVREEKNSKSAILGKLYNYEIFSCSYGKGDWYPILRINNLEGENQHYLEGYVHKSRIKILENWKSVRKSNLFADSCMIKTSDLVVVIKKTKFSIKNHKLFYSKPNLKEQIGRSLMKIDGKRYWGTDGDVPKSEISSLKVIINGKLIQLPKEAYHNLYEPMLNTSSVLSANNTIYITMQNSDGAGGYAIIWIIRDGKYAGRYIDDSNA